MEYIIKNNEQFGSLEIYFSGKPSEAIRTALKDKRFRWNGKKSCWYGFADAEKIKTAIDAAEAPLVIPESSFVDGGGLYDGWKGGNNAKWSTDKELKALILADFKRAGISASIRFGRGGYLTSFTVTIKINADEIKSYEEWRKDHEYDIFFGGFPWISYTDNNGNYKDILKEEALNKEGAEGEELRENIRKTAYKIRVNHLFDSGNCHSGEEDVLTEEGNKKFLTVQAIVNSYNRDCSNGMIDYFDRDIYDHYTFKVA